MTTLLHIDSSIFGDDGQSSRLARQFVRQWSGTRQGTRVVHRDLSRDPVPHLTAETFQAFVTSPEERTPEQRRAVETSDRLIAELRESDVLVIALPMYNFGVPSTLKAWFDHVARAGETFRYTADGSEGLLTGRRAYVVATRGGRYQGTDLDTQSAYMRNFLGFLGMDSVEFVYAEGLAMGEPDRAAALEAANSDLHSLAAA